MLVSNFATRLNEAINIKHIKPAEIVRISEKLYDDGKINKPLTKPLLSNYLKGSYEAKQDNVYALSLILNIDEAWLMGYDVPMNEIKKKDNDKLFLIPVLGKIAAGQPILAEQYIEGYLPIDPSIYGMSSPDDYFYLRVSGESMNLKISNGDYALIQKQDTADDGDIIAAIVNGDEEATLKKYKRINEETVALEPMSTFPMDTIYINLKEKNFKIIGKAIGKFGKF